MKNLLLISLAALAIFNSGLNSTAYAQESAEPPKPFQSESEAGAVVVSGNSSSESYSAKTNNTYSLGKDVYKIFGRFLRSTAGGTESAKSWEAGVRYERVLNDYFNLFVGHKAESDVYSGYIQRDSQDLGTKYFIHQSDEYTWVAELGYRYSTTYQTTGIKNYDSYGRLYTEIRKSISPSVQLRYWAEYLPNFTNAEAYLANTEASLSVMLSEVFSLKLSYLMQYQNKPVAAGKYVDTTYTTSLVAKF